MRVFASLVVVTAVAAYQATLEANNNPAVLTMMAAMDIEAEVAAAAEHYRTTLEKVAIVGKVHNVSTDFFASAVKTSSEEGTLYSASWQVPNAFSIAIHFDRFVIPEGGAVFIIGGRSVEGPLDHTVKWDAGNYMTRHFQGNQVTIQYFHSKGTVGFPQINVEHVTGAFVDLYAPLAGICNIQAICASGCLRGTSCSPNPFTCSGCDPANRACSIRCTRSGGQATGAIWANTDWTTQEQFGVTVMASASGSRFCSGSFINNAGRLPLLLTAAHCGVGASSTIHRGYRLNDCDSADDRGGDFISEGNLRVVANAAESDMTLVEVQACNNADRCRNVYLAGWDALIPQPANGDPVVRNVIGQHHPNVDNMKISHGGFVIGSRWSGTGDFTHWRINAWTEATTEPGSSGSPLYARDTKRIIGQLHGGSAACPAFNGWDAYGGVFRSYNQNAAFASALAGTTGVRAMDGRPLYA